VRTCGPMAVRRNSHVLMFTYCMRRESAVSTAPISSFHFLSDNPTGPRFTICGFFSHGRTHRPASTTLTVISDHFTLVILDLIGDPRPIYRIQGARRASPLAACALACSHCLPTGHSECQRRISKNETRSLLVGSSAQIDSSYSNVDISPITTRPKEYETRVSCD